MTTFPPKSPCPTCGCDLALSAAPPVQMEAVARETCPLCGGTGSYGLGDYRERCTACDGFGTITPTPPPVPSPVQHEAVAYICEGCGRLAEDPLADLLAIQDGGGIACCPERNVQPLFASPVPSYERDEIIEMCAKLIEENMLCDDLEGGELLMPRTNPGNRVGFAYAKAIRSLKSQPAQEAE